MWFKWYLLTEFNKLFYGTLCRLYGVYPLEISKEVKEIGSGCLSGRPFGIWKNDYATVYVRLLTK